MNYWVKEVALVIVTGKSSSRNSCFISVILFLALLCSMIESATALGIVEDTTSQVAMSQSPKHLIIIQADDLGYDDLGHNGNPLAYTPNLDKLAQKSVQFMDFTVNPVCAPSRATLLTGRHFLRTGVSHVHGGKDFLHRNEKTLADVMKAEGWRTGMWGKWHLGRGTGYDPWDRGFDDAYAAELYKHEATRGEFNDEHVEHTQYCDDVIVDYALDFLDRTGDQPSLLYLPSMTPHGPLAASKEWIDFHRQRDVPGNLAKLYAMVSQLDAAVGRLITGLEERGCLEDTLLLFTSDNGPAINRGILTDEERHLRKCSARRGWKGDLWENGVRAPLLIHWPKGLQASVVSDPYDQVDLMPTLLDFCNVEWPDSYPVLDGKSRRDLIEGTTGKQAQDDDQPIYNYAHAGWITSKRAYDPVGILDEYNPVHPEDKALIDALEQPISVREGRFKLLLNPLPPEDNQTPEWVLIDLHEDPGESTNLANQYPETFADLSNKLLNWFSEIKEAPHSFTAPIISLSVNKTNYIPARLPYRLNGKLKNTVMDLRGWGNVGDRATYKISLSEPMVVTPILRWTKAPPAGFQFSVRCEAKKGTAISDGSNTLKLPSIELNEAIRELIIQLDSANIDSVDDAHSFQLVEIELQ